MGLMGLMGRFAVAALLTGCLTSWVVILLKKWGVIERVQVNGDLWFAKLVHRRKWLEDYYNNNNPMPNPVYKLASCDFCLNWWLSWCVVVVALVVTGEWWLVGVPFFSTTIGRWLSA